MTAIVKEIVKAIRAHRGEVCVGVLARDDVFYVKAVKADLIDSLKNMSDYQVTISVKNGVLYLDNYAGFEED